MTRVFLCDDHGIVREGTKAVLSSIPGLEIVGEAASAEALIDRLPQERFDLAIVDVTMDGMDGVTLAGRIKAAQPQTRVIALTFHRDPATVRAFLATGAEGYILKDDPPARIREAVEQVMAGRRSISAEVADVLVRSWQDREPDSAERSEPLTSREREVLRLLFRGLINKEMASQLGISVKTIEKVRSALMRKSRARTPTELSAWALRTGWISG